MGGERPRSAKLKEKLDNPRLELMMHHEVGPVGRPFGTMKCQPQPKELHEGLDRHQRRLPRPA